MNEVTFDLCLTVLYISVIRKWVVGEEASDWKLQIHIKKDKQCSPVGSE